MTREVILNNVYFSNKPPVQVFAGMNQVMALTSSGELYYFDLHLEKKVIYPDDRSGFNLDNIPCEYASKIAENVISAALSRDYILYVTLDGCVHILGQGIFKDKFPGFQGAVAVYADNSDNCFWIVDRDNHTFFFGNSGGNRCRNTIFPDIEIIKKLSEEVCVVEYSYGQRKGIKGILDTEEDVRSDYQQRISELKDQLVYSSEFLRLSEAYKDSCELTLELNQTSVSVLDERERPNVTKRELLKFHPRIVANCGEIYKPVLLAENIDWDTAHRTLGVPSQLPDDFQKRKEDISVKKACVGSLTSLVMQEDGKVIFYDEWDSARALTWHDARALDISISLRYAAVAFEGGNVIVYDIDDDHLEENLDNWRRWVRIPGHKHYPGCGKLMEAVPGLCNTCYFAKHPHPFPVRDSSEKTQLIPEVIPSIRVYSGTRHLLILSDKGELFRACPLRFGFGSSGEIEAKLVAEDVIDAAAVGDGYLYVTKDKRVHYANLNLREQVLQIPGAVRVFADEDHKGFWILAENGNTYSFLHNPYSCGNNGFNPEKQVFLKLPEETAVVNYRCIRSRLRLYSTNNSEQVEKQLLEKLEKDPQWLYWTRENRRAGSFSMELKLVSRQILGGKTRFHPNRRELYTYVPQILIGKDPIRDPMKVPVQLDGSFPHRAAKMPAPLQERFRQDAQRIKKVCSCKADDIVLYQDGTVKLFSQGKEFRHYAKEGKEAVDVDIGGGNAAIAFSDGQVILGFCSGDGRIDTFEAWVTVRLPKKL